MLFRKKKAAHRAEAARRYRRKVLGLPIIGWVLGIAGTALAIAGFIVLLGSSGTVTAGQAIDVSYRSVGAFSVTQQDGATCSVSRISNGEIQITASNAYPGGHCSFSVSVENGGQAAARLQAFRMGSGGGSLTAEVATCGQTLNALNGNGDVAFTIHFGALTAGQVITLNPSNTGLEWVAANLYDAGECNV